MRYVIEPDWKNADFKSKNLEKILDHRDFNALVKYLNRHGGLDGVDEYGMTALMRLLQREDGRYFAKRLVEMGCDLNRISLRGWTALGIAVGGDDYEMAEYLLKRPGIDAQSISCLDLKDRMAAIFVRNGYEVFGPQVPDVDLLHVDLLHYDPPHIEYWLNRHQGSYTSIDSSPIYEYFGETLEAVHQLYPDRLPEVPPFYLDTVEYDFLFEDFLGWEPRDRAGLMSFIEKLDRGLESRDEGGRNLLACAAELPDLYFRPMLSGPFAEPPEPRSRVWARELIAMGVSLTQPDFSGRTPADHLRVNGLGDLIPNG